jgi:aspartyl protease family protein
MAEQYNPNRRSGLWMLVAAWLLIMGGLYWFFGGWAARQDNPNTAAVIDRQHGELRLARNRAGHYVADGEIDGRRVRFLLDTGATWVALSTDLARELGLKRGAAVTLQTANGDALGYQTRLASVRVGPIELHNVAALVTDGMDNDTVLLGMSFLNRIEFAQRGGELVLSVPPAAQPPAASRE